MNQKIQTKTYNKEKIIPSFLGQKITLKHGGWGGGVVIDFTLTVPSTVTLTCYYILCFNR